MRAGGTGKAFMAATYLYERSYIIPSARRRHQQHHQLSSERKDKKFKQYAIQIQTLAVPSSNITLKQCQTYNHKVREPFPIDAAAAERMEYGLH